MQACCACVKQKLDDDAGEELSLHDLELLHLRSWSLGLAAIATLRGYTGTLVARLGAACSGAATGSTTPSAKRSRPTTRAKDDSAAGTTKKTMQLFARCRANVEAAR